jgi:hypothetical protein
MKNLRFHSTLHIWLIDNYLIKGIFSCWSLTTMMHIGVNWLLWKWFLLFHMWLLERIRTLAIRFNLIMLVKRRLSCWVHVDFTNLPSFLDHIYLSKSFHDLKLSHIIHEWIIVHWVFICNCFYIALLFFLDLIIINTFVFL